MKKTTSTSTAATAATEKMATQTALALLLVMGLAPVSNAATPAAEAQNPDCIPTAPASPEESVGFIKGLLQKIQGKATTYVQKMGEVPYCANGSVNLRKVSPGFKCRTSAGKIVERVKPESGLDIEAWKVEGSPLIWGDMMENKKTQERGFAYADAVHTCDLIGARLPTPDEYRAAKADDLKEVIPYMEEGGFWTSEKVEPDLHYVFSFRKNGSPYVPDLATQLVRCVTGPIVTATSAVTDLKSLTALKKQWNPSTPQLIAAMKSLLVKAKSPEEFLEILDPTQELSGPGYNEFLKQVDALWVTHAMAFFKSNPSQEQLAKALASAFGVNGPAAIGKAMIEETEGNAEAAISALDLINRSVPTELQGPVLSKVLDKSYRSFLNSHPNPRQIQQVIDMSQMITPEALHGLSSAAVRSAKSADEFIATLNQLAKDQSKMQLQVEREKSPLASVTRENVQQFQAMNPTEQQLMRFNELRPETRVTDKLLMSRLSKAKTAADFVTAFEVVPKSTRAYVWGKVAPEFFKLKPTQAQIDRARELGATEDFDRLTRLDALKSAKGADQILAILDQGFKDDEISSYFIKNSRAYLSSMPKGRSVESFQSALRRIPSEDAALALRTARAETATTPEDLLAAFDHTGSSTGSAEYQAKMAELFSIHLDRLLKMKLDSFQNAKVKKLAATPEVKEAISRARMAQAKTAEEYIGYFSAHDAETQARLLKESSAAFLDKKPSWEQYQHVLTLNQNATADFELRRLALQRAKTADDMVSALSVSTTRYDEEASKPLDTLVDQTVPRFLKAKPTLRQMGWLKKNYRLNPTSLDLLSAAAEEKAKTPAEKQLFDSLFKAQDTGPVRPAAKPVAPVNPADETAEARALRENPDLKNFLGKFKREGTDTELNFRQDGEDIFALLGEAPYYFHCDQRECLILPKKSSSSAYPDTKITLLAGKGLKICWNKGQTCYVHTRIDAPITAPQPQAAPAQPSAGGCQNDPEYKLFQSAYSFATSSNGFSMGDEGATQYAQELLKQYECSEVGGVVQVSGWLWKIARGKLEMAYSDALAFTKENASKVCRVDLDLYGEAEKLSSKAHDELKLSSGPAKAFVRDQLLKQFFSCPGKVIKGDSH